MSNSLKKPETFEIQKIGAGKPESGSLMFKITKVLGKNNRAKNLMNKVNGSPESSGQLSFTENVNEKDKKLLDEIKIENLTQENEINLSAVKNFEKSSLSTHQTRVRNGKPMELRRTTRRIVPVQKDFFSDFTRVKKQRRSKIETQGLVKKKKSGRGPGRPRKVLDPNLVKQSTPKINKKEIKTSRKNSGSPFPTFESYLQRSFFAEANYSQNQNCYFVENVNASFRKNSMDFLQAPVQNLEEKQEMNYKQQSTSSKPTVIYFKTPKNHTYPISAAGRATYNFTKPFSNNSLIEYMQHKEQSDKIYLKQKYGMIDAIMLDHIYGFCQGNVQRADVLLRNFIACEKEILHFEDNSPYIRQKTLMDEGMHDSLNHSQVLSQAHNFSDSNVAKDVDTLNRQIIVNTIRLLYDEESVLGY